MANALSSKHPKEAWKVIHRVLHPSPKPLREDPEKLNRYFISTAARTLGTKPDAFFRDNQASIWKRRPYVALYFKAIYKYC